MHETDKPGALGSNAGLGPLVECQHTWTQGRKDERGSWCCACGVKVYDVDRRQCKDCAHSSKLWNGTICNKHLMRVTPDMNVTFKIAEGSCWTPRVYEAPVTECEACLTEDACRIRGQCAHYLRERA